MNLLDIIEYKNELDKFLKTENLSFFRNKTIFIAGASGLIMSYFIDLFILSNIDVKLILLTSSGKAQKRFRRDKRIKYINCDIRDPRILNLCREKIDYILNFASLADPKSYQNRPIDTMTINIYGTKNLLDLAHENNAIFLYASSCEIYGELNIKKIKENCFGLVDPINTRSCYNESKRAAETLCACYAKEKGIKFKIARFSRTFGPTQSLNDTKALSQFMLNALNKENIILKSSGKQLFSYTYVQDSVSAIIYILKKGSINEAYNVANKEIHNLKQIALMVSQYSNSDVIIDLKSDKYKDSYSKSINSVLDCTKLYKIGWKDKVSIKSGIKQTLLILDILKKIS